jgi:hypothetical protein
MPQQNQEAPADLLTAILPSATERAIDAYQYFSSGPPPTDTKEFGSFQTACKAAISHLTALFQLQRLAAAASSAAKPGGPSAEDKRIADLVARTEHAMQLLAGPNPPDEV